MIAYDCVSRFEFQAHVNQILKDSELDAPWVRLLPTNPGQQKATGDDQEIESKSKQNESIYAIIREISASEPLPQASSRSRFSIDDSREATASPLPIQTDAGDSMPLSVPKPTRPPVRKPEIPTPRRFISSAHKNGIVGGNLHVDEVVPRRVNRTLSKFKQASKNGASTPERFAKSR